MADEEHWRAVPGRVVRGHLVASGLSPDTPYPDSSIRLQKPFFAERGLDLSGFHDATINVDISPRRFRIRKPHVTFPAVRWTDLHPPENFSFLHCKVMTARRKVSGLIYFPHPETKETHFQSDNVLEVLAPFLPGLEYGSPVTLEMDPREVEII